jgi:hypothetical protein
MLEQSLGAFLLPRWFADVYSCSSLLGLEVSIEDDVTERTGAKPLQPLRNEATYSLEQAVQEAL